MKNKSSTANTSGERFSKKYNKEALEYNNSIIYCDMIDVFSSFLCVVTLMNELFSNVGYLCIAIVHNEYTVYAKKFMILCSTVKEVPLIC